MRDPLLRRRFAVVLAERLTVVRPTDMLLRALGRVLPPAQPFPTPSAVAAREGLMVYLPWLLLFCFAPLLARAHCGVAHPEGWARPFRALHSRAAFGGRRA